MRVIASDKTKEEEPLPELTTSVNLAAPKVVAGSAFA